MQLSDSRLDFLRGEIQKHISGKRLLHTYAVENEIKRLGELYGFNEGEITKLRVSALLHDITKEIKTDGQLSLCKEHGITVTDDELKSPKLFHSMTGAYVSRKLFPELVDEAVFNAILYHTSGREAMTLFEKLLYLADYIEETRTFSDCVRLRELFYAAESFTEKHLNRILLISFDMTIKNLIEDGYFIHPKTVKARNFLVNI